MLKICNQCKQEKDISEFYTSGKTKSGRYMYRSVCKECEKKNKLVKLEDRVVPPKEITDNPVYKKCSSMAADAHARIFAPSRRYKTIYNNLITPFGFDGSGELKWYLYNNFYNDIKDLLDAEDIPSMDRKDSSIGYTPNNIRIISFKLNTELGVETRRKKVKMITPDNEEVIFNSTVECVAYFGFPPTHSNKVSSWVNKTGKYKIPEGYSFSYMY